MKIKAKFAALLRRWAYALNPETPATLPTATSLPKVVSIVGYPLPDGKMPTPETIKHFYKVLTEEVLTQVQDCGYIRHRADIHPVPGGMIDYEASLYVGFIPRKKTK
ncbi:hypothetical protein [uncultured Duncaniella sp.]|uniref:hypothetical protein n=1 Tax=uncultured Duncaniella sp. TaxID=2768039 RepID=UPI002711D9BF|nr:hypothetical protein [uncultured Duncaniella sp.]